MKRIVIGLVLSLATCTAVFAVGEAIAERQKVMKTNGAVTKDMVMMMKGQAPFDLAKIKQSLQTYQDNTATFVTLFPPDSKSGGNTTAAPKIWDDNASFVAENEKFTKAAKAASESITDETTFKAVFPELLKSCGSCHEAYRVKNG